MVQILYLYMYKRVPCLYGYFVCFTFNGERKKNVLVSREGEGKRTRISSLDVGSIFIFLLYSNPHPIHRFKCHPLRYFLNRYSACYSRKKKIRTQNTRTGKKGKKIKKNARSKEKYYKPLRRRTQNKTTTR